MSEGSYRKAYVRCPFYRADDGRAVITCEGIVERSVLSWKFGTRKDYLCQMHTYCEKHFDRCEVYAMLAAAYEEGES